MLVPWRKLLSAAMLLFSGMAQAEMPPQPGSVAPAFALPDAAGKMRELADWRGKWVVLYFYPKDNTPGCTREAANFRESLPQLGALNAQVVGVSLDESASHRTFADELRLPFPLLADSGGAVSRRYGALADWGVLKFAKRYTFLIDPEGRVAKTYLQVDADRHAAEVIADLKALTATK